MGIFRVTMAGRKAPLLVKGAGMREAKDRIITACDPLNADEMETALTEGETVWRDGEPFPADKSDTDPLSGANLEAERDYLQWFHQEADFGPAEGDVRAALNKRYTAETQNPVPEGYGTEE
jgi:hypothetical protein